MAHFDSLKGEQKAGFVVSMLFDSILGWFSILLLCFIVLFSCSVWFGFIDSGTVNNFFVWVLGKTLSNVAWWNNVSVKFYSPEGLVVGFKLSEFARIEKSISESLQGLWLALVACLSMALLAAVGVWWAYKKMALVGVFGDKRSKVFLRGGAKVEELELATFLTKTKQDSDLKIGELPLVKDSENRHILVAGDTGAGKSQAIMQLLAQIRARGEKTFVYDASGDFTKHFYRQGKDILLAPFDERSVNWTPFAEGCEYQDMERIASSFAPPGVDGDKHKHWDDSANLIFTSLLFAIAKSDSIDNTNESLVRAIATKTKRLQTDELGNEKVVIETLLDELIKGTLAEGVINSESPTHKSDVIATLIPKIRSLQYLLGLEGKTPFSITDWVNDDKSDSWVFVRVNENQLKLSQALITAWVDTLVTSVLSREPNPSKRIWLITDETQGLGRINSLYDAVEKGRKYNFACVLGFTSHKKMEQIYGEKLMSSLLSSLSTKLCYRYSDPSASEWVSKLLGEEEVIEGRTSIGRHKESSLTEQEEKRREALVLPTEIQNLNDLNCFVKLPGGLPISCVKTRYESRKNVADYWVKRKMPDPIVVETVVKDERTKKKASKNEQSSQRRSQYKPNQLEPEPLLDKPFI
jgi:type IV secretory pathway TraG/TraD family ATPase VirD4